jgi:hypothetical protein
MSLRSSPGISPAFFLFPTCAAAVADPRRKPLPHDERLRTSAQVRNRQAVQRPANFPFSPSTQSFPEVVS